MSEYTNFLTEFPQRCQNILFPTGGNIDGNGESYEFTRLILLASAIFVIPYERLNGDTKYRKFLTDENEFSAVKNPLFDSNIKDHPEFGIENWLICKVTDEPSENNWLSCNNKLENFNDDSNERGRRTSTLDFFFYLIRCGLAHGNIKIKNNLKDIERVIFIKKEMGSSTESLFLSLSYGDLKKFLEVWNKFLQSVSIPEATRYDTTSVGED